MDNSQKQEEKPIVDTYMQPFDQCKLPTIHSFFTEVLHLQPQQIPSDQQIINQPLTNPRQKTINVDCLRTRSDFFTESLRAQMQQLLTHYCRVYDFSYKQGMHQIAAPFIFLIKGGATIGQCSGLFHKFFSRFCLNFYQDDNFNSIQLFVKMFSVVLKYHDPAVYRYLQWHDVEPQIFCISWLMTLFSSKLSFEHTYQLWAFLSLENDPYLLFFIVLSMVVTNRQNILEQKNVNILHIVTNLMFKDGEQLRSVVERALLLRKQTPSSLVILFRDRAVFEKRDSKNLDFSDINTLVANITNINLFLILPSQMILEEHLKRGICKKDCYFCDLRKPIKKPSSIISPNLQTLMQTANQIREMDYRRQYVLVDLRKTKKDKIKHEGQVFEVDPNEDIEEVEQRFITQFLQQKYCKHFVFILTMFSFENMEDSDDDEFQMCKNLLQRLTSMSFPLLSILEGGFIAMQNQSQPEEAKIQLHQNGSKLSQSHLKMQKMRGIPFDINLTIGNRWKIANCLINKGIIHQEGVIEILIMTQYFILICQKSKELLYFLNYFRHTSSPMQYLYDRLHSPQSLHIRKVIPLHLLKKASMKIHHQNTLVISHESCRHFENQPSVSLDDLFDMNGDKFMEILQECEDCLGARRKSVIEMMSPQTVKECSNILARKYVKLRKQLDALQQKSMKKSKPLSSPNKSLISHENKN